MGRRLRADRIAAAVRAGVRPSAVAAQFDVPIETVRNACYQRGVPCRDLSFGREFLPTGATLHFDLGWRPYALIPGVEGRCWFCRDCETWLPEEEFRAASNPDLMCGVTPYCCPCLRERDRVRGAKNRARAKARVAA